jgi:hypothetical protein
MGIEYFGWRLGVTEKNMWFIHRPNAAPAKNKSNSLGMKNFLVVIGDWLNCPFGPLTILCF